MDSVTGEAIRLVPDLSTDSNDAPTRLFLGDRMYVSLPCHWEISVPAFMFRYAFLAVVLGIATFAVSVWFSEASVFTRFTREVGVPLEESFTSNFVTRVEIEAFISSRGYNDPFTYFEEAVGLRPWVSGIADADTPESTKKRLLARGADTLTAYSINNVFSETRVIILHRENEVKEMTSRQFGTSF